MYMFSAGVPAWYNKAPARSWVILKKQERGVSRQTCRWKKVRTSSSTKPSTPQDQHSSRPPLPPCRARCPYFCAYPHPPLSSSPSFQSAPLFISPDPLALSPTSLYLPLPSLLWKPGAARQPKAVKVFWKFSNLNTRANWSFWSSGNLRKNSWLSHCTNAHGFKQYAIWS